jgi:hypothetical protein
MVINSEYLEPTEFLDFNKKRVSEKAFEITKDLKTDKDKVVALFYWVRDSLKYNALSYYPKIKLNLKASVSIRRETGFCMSKAATLSALARAIGIPARIHMADIINHKSSQKLQDLMGSNVFHCHGYSEMYLNGKWVKATPVFDRETCEKAGFFPMVEFDGEHDALLASHDMEGNKFIEYTADYGLFSDVPIEKINEIFLANYPTWYGPDIEMSTVLTKTKNKEPESLDK